MKTIRVSDEVHRKLLRLMGERMAKTGKVQTFNDTLADLIEMCQEKRQLTKK